MRWSQAVLVVLAYLLGSIPTAYIFARARAGVDLRRVGSGTVGGSNLARLHGAWATVFVGVLDILKGWLPVWLGLRLGLGEVTACVAGLAAVIAHDWCPWLGLKGGRGVACTLGVLLAVFPYGCLWLLVVLGIGAILRQVGSAYFAAILLLPGFALLLGQSNVVFVLTVALLALTVIKRLEANLRFRVTPPPGAWADRGGSERSAASIYLSRLLLDNDHWSQEPA